MAEGTGDRHHIEYFRIIAFDNYTIIDYLTAQIDKSKT